MTQDAREKVPPTPRAKRHSKASNGPTRAQEAPASGAGAHPQDTIRYLTLEEWESLRAVVDVQRDKILLQLLYSTGCRVGELVAIQLEDVDWEGSFIRVASINTKTRQPRTMRVSRELLSDVKAYLRVENRLGKKAGPLFYSSHRQPLTKRRVQQLVRHYADQAGVQRVYGHDTKGRPLYAVTAHTLRHSHIVHALARRIPLPAVQKQVGHRRLATTQVYTNLAPHEVQRAYDEGGFH